MTFESTCVLSIYCVGQFLWHTERVRNKEINFKCSTYCWADPKNLLSAALLALQCKVAGIMVSNHGARQLDHVPATISVLEEVSLLYVLNNYGNPHSLTWFRNALNGK